MTKTISNSDDGKLAHLAMIQGVVSRLETNCFTLKALAMTLATAVLAFMGAAEKVQWVFSIAGLLPITVFWIMDAQYLRLGRCFRRLYNAVRLNKIEDPFSMDFRKYAKEEQSVIRIAISWSILWFYASILIAFLTVTCFLI